MTVAGLLLAAGGGRRMGRPKAAVELDGEPLVRRAVGALRGAGLDPVVVVLGAGLPEVAELLPDGTAWVPAPGWDTEGQAASLRAGLEALSGTDAVAAVVALVDTPGIGREALARVAARADGPEVLARGAVAGRAGHPVLLGRAHWEAVRAAATGDAGARGFLRGRDDVAAVEIGDVAVPDDLDTPDDLQRWTSREEAGR
ncbi:nucleotidyltransferase family protein [Actinomycetospora lemnae]|uniref:NTP transferase domain-containing protein n=1 Tax=Actinomycetospora lemnae TaxID=3019891 RepID=A0ABT5T222_9PSEU|nr:NTP transferase domain-containing protein [Actinomycetospora sp. DW7H6]MDD7969162.1 NTP transferase domain-containing protein [Actinomycetospora sp. DW7H6]